METGHRTLAATAVALGSAVGIVLLATSVAQVQPGVARVEDVVAVAVQMVGAAILLWYLATALVALACLAMRAAGDGWTAGERRLVRSGAPLARRLLGAGAGVAVAAAAVVAPAAAATSPAFDIDDDLGWGATQDADDAAPDDSMPDQPTPETPVDDQGDRTPSASGGSTTRPATTVSGPAPSAAAPEDAPPSYVVVRGDTLWDIAADHLPASAETADIAASWPDWYELNRDVVGPDPDLILPGQVLVAPDHDPEEGA